MKTDVSSAISDLLFENNSIVIPGLGGFTASHKSSTIDYVQGALAPPSKELYFNENLMVNDGILVNYIQKKYELSAGESEDAIEKFVEETKANLTKREMVVFPKVGRLYRDYEDKIKFLPEATNFNTDSYGLPSVQFYPIIREKEAITKSKQATAIGAKPYKAKKQDDSELPLWMRVLLPILGVLSIIVIGAGLYIYGTSSDQGTFNEGLEVNENRLNKKPGEEEAAAGVDDNEDLEDLRMDDGEGNPEDDIISEEDTEAPTLNPNQKTAFIVLHSLRNSKNAEKFIQRLTKDGYAAHSSKENGMHKVGILKVYESKIELESAVLELKKAYKTTPVVLEGSFE